LNSPLTLTAATRQTLSAVKDSTTNHPIHDDRQVEITPKVDIIGEAVNDDVKKNNL